MSATRSTLTPQIAYDRRIGRYRDVQSGRLVSQQTVRRELDRVLDSTQRDARILTQQLRDRQISIATWQREMALTIRRSQSAAAALARGGWASMDARAWGQVGYRTREQLTYLRRFAAGMADGTIPMDGRVLSRAEQYVLAARTRYEAMRRELSVSLGYTEIRNILHARDSCTDCLAATALGWVPITASEMSTPGRRSCGPRCRCHLSFR